MLTSIMLIIMQLSSPTLLLSGDFLKCFFVGCLSRHYSLGEDMYPEFFNDDGTVMSWPDNIQSPDPTKVRMVGRPRREEEPRLLEVAVHRTRRFFLLLLLLLKMNWKLVLTIFLDQRVLMLMPEVGQSSRLLMLRVLLLVLHLR